MFGEAIKSKKLFVGFKICSSWLSIILICIVFASCSKKEEKDKEKGVYLELQQKEKLLAELIQREQELRIREKALARKIEQQTNQAKINPAKSNIISSKNSQKQYSRSLAKKRRSLIGKNFAIIMSKKKEKFYDVTITESTPVGFAFTHKNGAGFLKYKEMTKGDRARFYFDMFAYKNYIEKRNNYLNKKRQAKLDKKKSKIPAPKVEKNGLNERLLTEIYKKLEELEKKTQNNETQTKLQIDKISRKTLQNNPLFPLPTKPLINKHNPFSSKKPTQPKIEITKLMLLEDALREVRKQIRVATKKHRLLLSQKKISGLGAIIDDKKKKEKEIMLKIELEKQLQVNKNK